MIAAIYILAVDMEIGDKTCYSMFMYFPCGIALYDERFNYASMD